ncbi:MAG: bifunctional diguanylate cyclase/phosphodiesterase [Gammaproteobacteria bacterium]|nr:bifunctional diguanylate cyclase/phosphodiesterase [Gammaproteobacteria bacterium]
MKIRLPLFSASLILGMALVALLVWSWSLHQVIQKENRIQSADYRQLWQAQISHLQQKQRLWLQSQYYLISTLLGSRNQDQRLQAFLWDYYQRNPNVRSVSLIEFNPDGKIRYQPPKAGCLNLDQSSRQEFKNFLVPRFTSCRVGDKALLEIVGPVLQSSRNSALVISMDYFSFMKEFSNAAEKKLVLSGATQNLIEYSEVSDSRDNYDTFTINFEEEGQLLGQLHLARQSLGYIDLWLEQIVPVLGLLLLAVLLVYTQFNRLLVRPLLNLADKMRDTAAGHYSDNAGRFRPVTPGLKLMHEYFHAIQNMTKRDPLTGLNNRVIFEDRLIQAISEGKRSGRKYALILIDITNLETIINRQGQYLADALLKQLTQSLLSSLRESDNVSRIDKSIFAALLEVPDRDQLVSLAEKIFETLADRFLIYGRELDANIGMGIAIYPEHGADADQLYRNASAALIEAEKSEWPIVFYRSDDDQADYSGFTVIQSLRKAIENDELKLVFQPVIDFEDHHTVYLEALLRWKEPDSHKTSIERTIEIAEKNQLIKPLTNWIIAFTCQLLSELQIERLTIGINLSMIDLHDQHLPGRIESYLKQYGVKPEQLVIEITEGQIMQEPEEVIDILSRLGIMGLSLSIDDFGTGQASLTYLKELPVEKLKIDQSFIRDMVTNKEDRLIVKATIELAHTLDLKVIAEGVEIVEVYDILREMKCDYVQGYYISRPIEADQIPQWYKLVS